MRTIQVEVPGVKTPVRAHAMDEQDVDGMNHKYQFSFQREGQWENGSRLEFQEINKPNGVSNASVLAVLLDRLRAAQKNDVDTLGEAKALIHLETAMNCFLSKKEPQGPVKRKGA